MEQPWISVLMGVPTVYAQLIEAYEQMEREGDAIGARAIHSNLLCNHATCFSCHVVGQCHWLNINAEVCLVRCIIVYRHGIRARWLQSHSVDGERFCRLTHVSA